MSEQLKQKISAFKKSLSKKPIKNTSANAFGIVSEFVANILVGVFIGYQADKFFQTKGLLLLIFIFFALISFIYSAYKKLK